MRGPMISISAGMLPLCRMPSALVHHSMPAAARVAVLGMVTVIAIAAVRVRAVAQSRSPRPIPELAVGVISAAQARQHVDVLASDLMNGRDTPSPGLDSAARYIAAVFRESGLEPVNGSYYHEYNLKREGLGLPTSLKVNGRAIKLKSGFIPHEFSASGRAAAPVVFAGFGISRDSIYDDYAGVDVRGRVVLVIAGEPSAMAAQHPGRHDFSSLDHRAKMRIAARHGAVGFLMLPNPARTRFIYPAGHPWRMLDPEHGPDRRSLRLDLPTSEPAIPSASIGADAAREIFGTNMGAIVDVVRAIDTSGRPASRQLKARVELEVTIEKTTIPVRNVIGMVRGAILPDEYVVIGAHYDHVGWVDSAPPDISEQERATIDTIYNGADDNASGTAGLMLAARAFGVLPRDGRAARSVLFIAFSGEEKGLFGSRAYAAQPAVPLERTVAMLNMDMIGRNHPDSISVGGLSRSAGLAAVIEEANRAEPMMLAYDLEEMFYRSDQASFAVRKVPAIFLSSGLHGDYHQVTDEADRIDNGKIARVARLCFRTVWLLAELPVRPVFDTVDEDIPSLFD